MAKELTLNELDESGQVDMAAEQRTRIEILKRMYESDAYISKRQLSMVFGWPYEGKEKKDGDTV